METVPGTIGYAQAADRFIELSESITFEKLHRPILEFIPTTESDVLDIGSGSGRDAAAFARMGHNVTAVEPNSGFIETATRKHPLPNIQWIEDSLPSLSALTTTFDKRYLDSTGISKESCRRLTHRCSGESDDALRILVLGIITQRKEPADETAWIDQPHCSYGL